MSLHEEPATPVNEGGYSADKHIAAETTISPKLIAGALTGLALAIVVAVLGAVTPDMLESLGAWAPLAFVAITTAATQLSVYLRRDPLREV